MSDFLREVVEKGLNAPSGERICTCHNPNAVKEGLETPCWYCELHAALASRPVEAKADAGDRALLADGPEGPGLREAKPGYEESGWLIELPTSTGPKWWTAETMTGRWESDSTLAVRFSRKQDAEAVIEALMLTGTKATEHLWADLDTVCPRCEGQKYDKGTCSLCNNTGWVNEVPRRAPADALREDHL